MGQDPNQPYNPYGQQPPSGMPPQGQGGEYYQGYSQQPPQGAYPPPNTGYQQPQYGQPAPGYQQPYGQPGQQGPYNTANPLGPTTVNMEPNIMAGLSYLGAWVTGLIFFLIEKQNRFVRFHAMQSLLLFASLTILSIALGIVTSVLSYYVVFIGCFTSPLIWVLWLAGWITGMVMAFQGRYFKLPVIGDYAERWANSSTGTPLR